jgi:opacity protein-like surface antigen
LRVAEQGDMHEADIDRQRFGACYRSPGIRCRPSSCCRAAAAGSCRLHSGCAGFQLDRFLRRPQCRWRIRLLELDHAVWTGRQLLDDRGVNYQIGQFVIGAEGDFDWQNLRGATATGFCGIAAVGGCAVASNWIATIRGRAGFAADRALFYITGGGAFTNVKPSTAALPYGGGTEAGWTAGGGIEYAVTDNWTAKVEYLYANFQSATCNASACAAPLAVPAMAIAPATVSFHENIVRAGVNYKF